MNPIYLSSYTLTTCLGAGRKTNWDAIVDRQTGLAPCVFETANLPTFVGQVKGVEDEFVPGRLSSYLCRNNQLAQLALRQDEFCDAVEAVLRTHGPHRLGVFLGTSTSGILNTELAYRFRDAKTGALPNTFHYEQTHNTYSVAGFVRNFFELEGPAVAVSSACSSSAKVFGNAARMMHCGLIDAAIVGGVDSLCLTTLYGFNSLELLSNEPCRPFDAERKGISIAEAAGFALLTRDKPSSGASIAVTGIGESSDAHHMSSPHPQGAGAGAAMSQALQMAGIKPEAIDYINLHGTATRSNDAAEGLAIEALFGSSTPCSSTKGHTGHALGAAGIVEAIVCALALENRILPGGVNTTKPDPLLAVHYLMKNQPADIKAVVSNSFGFGGSNCSLVLERK
jgi:3-oxoacyl-[acyl-carrier-protein] synthase I